MFIIGFMSDDQIRKEVLGLAEEGYLLPVCPDCDIILFVKEAKAGECDSCKAKWVFDDILWIDTDSLPQA